MLELSGWLNNPHEVDRIAQKQFIPVFMNGVPRGTTPVLLYEIYRKVAGGDDLDYQRIGDCVSWGYKHLVDFLQAVQIYTEMQKPSESVLLTEFQDTASEVIYALSRVEYGNFDGSYQDGSVGAWAAAAITQGGTLSRRKLEEILGAGKGKYDPKRAREWGAKGLPDDLEPVARDHRVATTSMVGTFTDAAYLIENGYGVAVCSDVGFANGPGGVTLRDEQGFAQPRDTWRHCMFFSGVRYDRPGLCCINQWPDAAFRGPLALNQPKNSFWVDERVVNRMLGQRDSWTASNYQGYPLRPLEYKF